jgi:hypothetical protein
MFDQLASKESLEKTKTALEKRGFTVILAETGADAKAKALELIPKGAEVMTMTSVTVASIGLEKELNQSGNYNPVKAKLYDEKTSAREKKVLGAAPEYATGSVHAITEEGKVFVASGTGSQLGAYTYGSDHVIWVVGTQKIVGNDELAQKRIWEHIVPQESVRGRAAYNLPETWNTYPSKIVTFNKESVPNRITIILVNEVLGF